MTLQTTTAQVPQARNKQPIPKRKMEFDLRSIEKPFWFADNGLITAFLSALSASFPPGEKEFVQSVMNYRDQITDPVLREQMRGFASQEGHHAYHHRLANDWLDSNGFAASVMEKDVQANIDVAVANGKPVVRLASTVVFEHITAILAEYLLTSEQTIEAMPEPVRELLMWHAVEEIEHKAVAFDVFEAVSGDRNLLRGLAVLLTIIFVAQQVRRTAMTLTALRHFPTAREVLQAGQFLFGEKGVLPAIANPYLDFFRKDFHPWDHDNRALVEGWKATHAALASA